MAWRLARSLAVLRDEVNARAPQRSKVSDGTLGDTAHAARKSDHNPDADGVVCAIDITDDPAHGHDDRVFAEHLRSLGAAGDKRVKYVIANGRIAGPSTRGWSWRTYTGSNAHDKHTHLSVTQAGKDSTAPWGWYVPTTQKDWFDMADEATLRKVVREELAAANAVFLAEDNNGQYIIREEDKKATRIASPAQFDALRLAFPHRGRIDLEQDYEVIG